MDDLLAKLSAPLDPARISWRVGATTKAKDKGMALAYIDSRDVQDRLDQVCGASWQCRYPHAGQKTVCEIGIKVGDVCIWRADGAGDTDVEQEKGALSDAFKRAAVKWGIGRYLYDIESPWVQIEPKGNSFVIAASEFPRLQKLLSGSKAVVAKSDDDPTKTKNPPGISAIKVQVRELLRDVHACSDAAELLAFMNTPDFKAFAFKVCWQFPNEWLGPEDNSGLSGSLAQIGEQLKCADEVHGWISRMERARDEKTKQAAE